MVNLVNDPILDGIVPKHVYNNINNLTKVYIQCNFAYQLVY